jgi:DNA-binding NarL/FixJ family response regulator
MLEAIRECLDKSCEVIRVVKDGFALVSEVLRLSPDVAVVDIDLLGLSGLDATAELKKMNCRTRVVFLTANSEPIILRAALASGVIGYVLQNRMVLDLPDAIEAVLRGRRFISAPLTGRRVSERPA